ncbi:hypothetical protein MESS4_780001 [Mesorhizobium sp. STM 4661]|nr:hypothetical protein MESS4_780001 [Mesorhizobium sp. STM 4661]
MIRILGRTTTRRLVYRKDLGQRKRPEVRNLTLRYVLFYHGIFPARHRRKSRWRATFSISMTATNLQATRTEKSVVPYPTSVTTR